jgi:hypothetical protein
LTVVESYLQVLYGLGVVCTERGIAKECALIGALNGGEIQIQHKVIRDEPVTIPPGAWNSRIFDAALQIQNYYKGFERFVRKFDPDLRMESVITIVKGANHEHGTAVFVTQEKRRCPLLDTVHGLTDEEALWRTHLSWAKFQPSLKSPQLETGVLYYPAEHSHVFEKYWNALDKPQVHPEFSQESDFTQACMRQYSAALGEMDISSFTPLVDGEAKHSHVEIAQEAAISRLCPIQDAPVQSRTILRSRGRGSTSLRLWAP